MSTEGRRRPVFWRLPFCVLGLLTVSLVPLAAQEVPAAPPPGATSPSAASQGLESEGSNGAVRAAPERHIVVSWKKVLGAVRYEVLIRPLGGDILIDRSTEETSIHAVLTPGTYQVRVISFNLFDKPASQSVWRYLDVIEVFTPVVSEFAPKILYAGVTSSPFAIDGANYLTETTIELLRGDRVVAKATNEEVAATRLAASFDLGAVTPGTYDLRVGNPENLFVILPGAVEVRPRIQPELASISLNRGYNDRTYRQIAVDGTGFIEGTSFFLARGNRRIDITSARIRSPEAASIDLNLGDAVPGVYDLVAANPGGLRSTLARAVTVQRITTPKFVSMSPTTFTIGTSKGDFVLRARDLIPEARVFLKRHSLLIPVLSAESAAKPGKDAGPAPAVQERALRADLARIAPGRYDLVMENSLDLTTVVSGLVIVNPEPPPRYVHPSSIKITAGYPYVLVLSPSFANAVTGSLIGGDVDAAFPLGAKFFPRLPAVRDMGMELELGDSRFTDLGGGSGGGTSLNVTAVGTNLYYRTPFRFPLNAVVRAGYGFTYSLFNLSTAQQSTSGSSMDSYVKLGASGELDIGTLITFEVGAEWMRILYANTNLDSLRVFVRGGVRLGS